jgi:hypothetical protein
MALERNLRSLQKRNVSYVITTFSDKVATISLMINGRKGLVTRNMALSYDTLEFSWVLYVGTKKYILLN